MVALAARPMQESMGGLQHKRLEELDEEEAGPKGISPYLHLQNPQKTLNRKRAGVERAGCHRCLVNTACFLWLLFPHFFGRFCLCYFVRTANLPPSGSQKSFNMQFALGSLSSSIPHQKINGNAEFSTGNFRLGTRFSTGKQII